MVNGNRDTRSGWVKAALFLQGGELALTAWGFLNLLLWWPRYGQYGQRATELLLLALGRTTLEAVAAAIAFLGLWRARRWGWILAVLTDATMCLLTLSSLVQYSAVLLHNFRWLAFSLWDFVAITVLLHHPVRTYFLTRTDSLSRVTVRGTDHSVQARSYPGLSTSPSGAAPKEIHWVERGMRISFYFIAAVVVTCSIMALLLSLWMGQKAGGGGGGRFLFVLWVGFSIGSAASFLFAVLLTLAARALGPGRLWAWLLTGALLAPGLTLGMGALGAKLAASQPRDGRILGLFFTGPLWLFQVWWLTIPAGVVAAFLCCQMYPWAFGDQFLRFTNTAKRFL